MQWYLQSGKVRYQVRAIPQGQRAFGAVCVTQVSFFFTLQSGST
jgi:hypothetical protein